MIAHRTRLVVFALAIGVGLHPVAPYNRQDAKGLVFLLGGRNLKCIGSNVADIVVMSTQALQTFTRHDHPDAVLAWEWPLLKNI